jgi:hypothetical protein
MSYVESNLMPEEPNEMGGAHTPIKKIDPPLEFRRNAVATVDASQSLNATKAA